MSQDVAPVEEQAKATEPPPKKTKPAETQEPSTGASEEEFKKAVQQAIQDQFKVTEAWKPQMIVRFVVQCPSGQQVLVKHLEPMDLIRVDLIEDLDSFQRKLFPAELDDQGRPVERNAGQTFFKMMTDPEKRVKFLDVTGRLMVACSLKPKIVNDGVALIDPEEYEEITGEEAASEGKKREIFGHQVENIDEQIRLFGKPIAPLKDNEVYAGVVGLPDRFTFFTELNKPLELIAPFRESSESLSDLESMQGNGNSPE